MEGYRRVENRDVLSEAFVISNREAVAPQSPGLAAERLPWVARLIWHNPVSGLWGSK
jgi:hypothetical protein